MGWQTYLLIGEGLVIVTLLSWEIFWLRKMYLMLHGTSDKLDHVIEAFKRVATQLENTSGPIANILKMFGPTKTTKE